MRNLLYSSILLILAFGIFPEVLAQNAQDYMNSGIDSYFDAKYEEALRHFNRVERLDPEYPDLYVYRGNAYYMLGDYQNAELDYNLALDKLPKPNRSSSNLSRAEAEGLNRRYAVVYNNLGVVQYLLGDRSLADEDFEIALDFDPDFRLAALNARNATSGRGNELDIQDMGGRNSRADYGRRTTRDDRYADNRYNDDRYRQRDNYNRTDPGERPNIGLAPSNPRKQRKNTEDLREVRQENWEDVVSPEEDETFLDKLFKSKPFIKRSVSRRGKTYKRPDFGLATQSYISVEFVKIVDRSTFVTIKVMNPDRQSYDINVAPKNDRNAYRIVARTASGHKEYALRRIANIYESPRTTELRAGVPLYFTLEFERIADNIGYINIVEGDKQSETAWNFYQVDLTE